MTRCKNNTPDNEGESVFVPPFLKWAGGKRWFADRCLHLIPPSYDRYIEPFLGSGAMFFALRPVSALVSDINGDLIDCYSAIKEYPTRVSAALKKHHEKHSKDYYYATRSKKPRGIVQKAAWFIYLNRTCWNGLYRVNLRNEFNVPIGTKTKVSLDSDNFEKISDLLADVEIRTQDFEETINAAQKGDFVFIDPPYTVKHNLNGFVKYNDKIFSWSDQVRLHRAVHRAAKRGAMLLITNANHKSVRELYAGLGSQIVIERASVLSGDALFRGQTEELAICTWQEGP